VAGAVTFYRFPVRLSYVRFEDTRSEDALHVVDTSLEGVELRFLDPPSDALDADFVALSIGGMSVNNVGGDGLDLSGATGRVAQLMVDGAGDKGVSVGESSHVTLRDVVVRGADIGVASKDSLVATVSTLRIAESNVGVALYIKKPEYGPAKLIGTDIDVEDARRPFYVQVASELSVDGTVPSDLDYEVASYELTP